MRAEITRGVRVLVPCSAILTRAVAKKPALIVWAPRITLSVSLKLNVVSAPSHREAAVA
jgi:hypothetical protein